MRFKLLFVIAILLIYASKCDTSVDPPEPFDHVAQEQIDNDSLVNYMQTHFVNADGELEEITNGETPVYNQVTAQSVVRHWEDIDEDVTYKLYYFVREQGINDNPSKVDSVHISYKGMLLDGVVFDLKSYGSWFQLTSVIRGWTESIPHFKSGDYTVLPDQSFEFSNQGKGILFIPSGLGYANVIQSNGVNVTIPSSSPLIFYIELNLIKRTDSDLDGILSMYEDVDNDGDYGNDDTDGDGIPNYYDNDDDGDDTLTKDENPDPNGDGNPSDAVDTDGDTIPDYLDTDNP
jgi:FKBP-type peptidyl-prolyl cis-trans isomerase